jgi:putative DNA primase/helicase
MLAQAVERLGDVRSITLDPIAVMVKGDSHKNVETRLGLQPFADLCASRGACGLGVHHFTKNTGGGDPLDRISGSLAFGALPRCVWVAAQDLNGIGARRVLMRVKMSNGPDRGGFDYKLDLRGLDNWPGIQAQRVLWGDALEGSARELLERLESKPQTGSAAEVFLREVLKDGPMMAAEVITKGNAQNLSEWVLRRALKKMGGSSEKASFQGAWIWELPK